MSAPTTPHPALSHRCPFCHSEPGHACRAHRGRGHEIDWPHSRRLALTRITTERQPATRVPALCCTCGNLRTASSDYSRRQDPNHASGPFGKAEGWRQTQSLKCDECGQRTRHALLHPADAPYQDTDERMQRIALGGDDDSEHPRSDEHISRLRREYRELSPHPRNPYLRHRYWIAEAEAAWTEGHKKITALCGEEITLQSDPSLPSTTSEIAGRIVAEQLSDTEYEDPETGLWWVDMPCVDCCRVSNDRYRASRRARMVDWMSWLYARPERVPDDHVESLIEIFEATQKADR